MSKYEEFQEWLNECPVKITRYEDFTDFFEVTFDVVDDEVEEVEQCVIDTNGDYAECVDRLVDSMSITEFQEHLEVKKFVRDNP